MVDRQIRTDGVLDPVVLHLLSSIPREDFVPKPYRKFACTDARIPLECAGPGHTMMTPREAAKLLEALQVKKTDRVLEIGTGSGFITACLAKLAKWVISVDIVAECSTLAREELNRLEIENVRLVVADASRGWSGSHPDEKPPFDVIVVTGSLPKLTDTLKNELAIGGRMFVVVGSLPIMQARLITRVDTQTWEEQNLFETELAPLRHAPHSEAFQF